MPPTDWAIVVGIRCYPGLGDLQGPVNDASAFREWVMSPTGGNVRPERLAFITSGDPPPATPLGAQPNHARVQQAFDSIMEVARTQGIPVGDRLYIYMAGHGFAPRFDDSALLAANATPDMAGYHVLAKLYGEYFLRNGQFREVLLFMDCCRESYPQVPPNLPPYVDHPMPMNNVRWFYGYGTKWSKLSRESLQVDGTVRGVFTLTLLAGLKGGASDEKGNITAASLGNFMHENMKSFLRPEDRDNPDVPKNPDLDYEAATANDFVIASVAAAPTYHVTIDIPAAADKKIVQIINQKLEVVATQPATPPQMQFNLHKGMYMVQVLGDGSLRKFDVGGTGDVHVDLGGA